MPDDVTPPPADEELIPTPRRRPDPLLGRLALVRDRAARADTRGWVEPPAGDDVVFAAGGTPAGAEAGT